ncbi:MAG: LytR C-terminal domain-containing protein [Betaproteobacteria bacterium]|nr:LytR C-terminal domain-containing protein [Betaproteobacteria bacterium]
MSLMDCLRVAGMVSAVGVAAVMSGCAGYPGKDKQAFSIRPAAYVKHGNAGPGAMYRLGRYYQEKSNYTEAISAYEKALAMNPDYVEAYNGLGVSHSLRGQHELALQYLRRALELSPMAAHLHNNLGYVHMTLGQVAEAAAAFEQALRLDPENRWTRRNVAVFYERTGLNQGAAMPAMAPPEFPPARTEAPAATRTRGASSASEPDATTAAAAVHKQAVPRSTGLRLVQVTPDVFEFKMAEGRLGDEGARGWNTSQDLASGIASLDSKGIHIEVSNGSGVSGMARQVSGFLRGKGLPQARLTDRQPFRQLQTEIHYRPGNHALAGQISRMMPKRIPVRESYNLRKDIQVRILLGRDAARNITFFSTGAT